MNTLKEILQSSIARLSNHSESARIDAEILLAYVLKKDRSFFFTHPEYELSPQEENDFKQLIDARIQGQPIAYLIHRQGFWDCELFVNEHTLIPRPETEILIELALLDTRENLNILDLGTGSGAIAIAIANARKDKHWSVTATDVDPATLAVAQHNASHQGLSNIQFICSDWFNNLPMQKFDVIISNPPYLAEDDPHLQQGDLRFEPIGALACANDGFAAFDIIINNAKSYLKSGGILLLEHGHEQQTTLLSMLNKAGFTHIEGFFDLNGLPRVVKGCA